MVEQDLGKATLLAWKDAGSNDAIHYAVVTPNYAHSAWQMIYPHTTGMSSYYVKTGFDGWLSKPISSGRISYKTVGKDKFREWVDTGKVVSSGSNVGTSLLESVVYKKGHKNSKGEGRMARQPVREPGHGGGVCDVFCTFLIISLQSKSHKHILVARTPPKQGFLDEFLRTRDHTR